VKIVLDECLPIRLPLEFPEHECVTVQDLQAKGTLDGPLLQRIASVFDVLITIKYWPSAADSLACAAGYAEVRCPALFKALRPRRLPPP
jgi:hypothetical protein